MALENLDSIDWKSLHHAYGSAADVPALIRVLASPDKARRDSAYQELYGNIWHQGTVYEASSFAVPFLLELLAEDQTEDKSSLLLLLASLATGSSYLEVHGPLHFFDGKRDSPEFQQKLETEKEWVRSTLQAVREGFPLFVAHLSHPDPEVRSSAANLLGKCQDRNAITEFVRIIEDEHRPLVLASILLALSDFQWYVPTVVSRHLDQGDSGVRFAAAVCTVKGSPERVSNKAINELVDCLIDSNPLDPYESLPYALFYPLTSLAADLLATLGAKKAGFVAPRLIESLPTIDSYALDEPIEALLGVTFDQSPSSVGRENLTDLQRAVLDVLVKTPSVWQDSDRLVRADELEKYGLPQDQESLRHFLEGS